jgi:hypothetical protein
MTAAGQTSQQFAPIAASGGGGNCLCLYNAYNHVTLTATSQDNGVAYSYASTTWRLQRGSSNNGITVVDGLGNMQRSSQLSDAIANATGPGAGAIGVKFSASPAAPSQPVPIVQANSTIPGTYSTSLSRPPLEGVWVAAAVEAITIAGSSATFGGAGYQELSVQVED